MNSDEVLKRLRLFLIVIAASLFVGALIELFLVNHTEDPVQWLAFVISGLGLLATLVLLLRRTQVTIVSLRVTMLVVMLGSLFGIYQHVTHNIALEKEIHPTASTQQLLSKGLAGANPLLAPGTLAVAALLALAATYKYSAAPER